MKRNRKNRSRPYSRATRQPKATFGNSSAPVFQPLEPRKLLTTLYANPDPNMGETDTFYGFVAMPAWYEGQNLDGQSVEDRAIRLGIRITDSDPTSHASVTVLDLAGHTLFPWTGNGEQNTEITVATEPENNMYWGTDNNTTVDVFGLDSGYNPGWQMATDANGNYIPGKWIPGSNFHPVRELTLNTDPPPTWDITNVPTDFTVTIPETGTWFIGMDGLWGTDDDVRAPIDYAGVLPGAGTDDRVLGTADDPSNFGMPADPFEAPTTTDFGPMFIDRRISGAIADDGVADFNNGIGQIILSGTTGTTHIVFFTVQDFTQFLPNDPFITVVDNQYVGIAWDPSTAQAYQAAGMGQVVVGNNTNANWAAISSQAPNFLMGWSQAFDRSTEGIFMADPSLNETVGRIFIDGSLYGLTHLAGAAQYIHTGYFGGKVIVDGDLDSFVVAGDAGYYITNGGVQDTRAGVTVGRVLGTFLTGGHDSAEIDVQGDFNPNSVVDKPFLNAGHVVQEMERVLNPTPFGTQMDYDIAFGSGAVGFVVTGGTDQPTLNYIRNDTFGLAQFVGRETSYVQVTGDLAGQSAMNQSTYGSGDEIDYFAIAVEPGKTLHIQLLDASGNDFNATLTLQDAYGRILQSRGDSGLTGTLTYTPNAGGVLYIVIENTEGLGPQAQSYSLIVNGLAPTTLGEVRSLTQMNFAVGSGAAIFTEVGSIGSVRVGQDYDSNNSDVPPPFIGNIFISAADTIWNITSGGGIGGGIDANDSAFSAPTVINADQNIGEILAGLGIDQTAGTPGSYLGGSFGDVTITAGGDIGMIWAQGAVDDSGQVVVGGDLGEIGGIDNMVMLTTVTADNVGVIHADNRIFGDNLPNDGMDKGLKLTVRDNGKVDLLEAGADPRSGADLAAPVGQAGIVQGQMLLNTGNAGDIRMVRAPFIWANGFDGSALEVANNQPITIVDDSGAVFTVRISGGSGLVTTQAIANSRGVALARIQANIAGNGSVTITNNSGLVEIGDIVVTAGGTGRVILNGSGRTDVYLIRGIGGLTEVQNLTTGDVIAIDTDTVDRVRIKGNLGKTYTSSAVGPVVLHGPFYGILVGGGGITGDPLGYLFGLSIDPLQGGAPMSPWLNGLSVRGGPTRSVLVDGTIFDVVSGGDVTRITTNYDKNTPVGDFNGIEGDIYVAGSLNRIDLGDGLVDTGSGPILPGIIAVGGVLNRVNITGEGHDILGYIDAFGFGIPNIYAINRITATKGADIYGAVINTAQLDAWFNHSAPAVGGAVDNAGGTPASRINQIRVTDGDIIESSIKGFYINRVNIKGGVWDSNELTSVNDLNQVTADSFVNNSVAGVSLINVAGNINSVLTNGSRGDIIELTIDALGSMKTLRGNDMVGLSVDVDEVLSRVDARAGITRSAFTTGALTNFRSQLNMTRLTVDVAGPVRTFQSRAGQISNLSMLVDGPDGALTNMTAKTNIDGDISISGPISKIQAQTGNITGTISTFSGDGDVKLIKAAGTIDVVFDVDGDLKTVQAGADFGSGGAFKVFGDLGNVDVSHGIFNANLVVQGAMTGNFKIDQFGADASIVSRGEISSLDINSDVAGQIVSYADGINKISINGDFTGSQILAKNGDISQLTIKGSMSGNITADEGIGTLTIGDNGAGDLTGIVYSDTDITRLDVKGNINNGIVLALHTIASLTVDGNATASTVGAGTQITRMDVGGDLDGSNVVAGLESLGSDNALGGFGLLADTYSNGQIQQLNVSGVINNSNIVAGVNAGSDGSFATIDASTDLPPGTSGIANIRVTGAATGTNLILADTSIGSVNIDGTDRTIGNPGPGVTLTQVDPAALNIVGGVSFDQSAPVTFTEADGDNVSITLRGSGAGIYSLDGTNNLNGLVFNGTSSSTNIDIVVTGGAGNGLVDLADVNIQFADDASVGTLNIGGNLDGADGILIDADANTITARAVNTSGTISVGGEAKNINVVSVASGAFTVTTLTGLNVSTGGFGGVIYSEYINTINVKNGVITGVIFGRDYIGSINNNSTGAGMYGASIASRGTINSVSTNYMDHLTYVSAGDLLNSVSISGNITDSDLLAGFSLGSDGRYGGVGTAADLLTAGVIQNVNVNGSFIRSSIAAGINRGTDHFYGNGDDIAALGLSEISNVNVRGSASGSNFNSQNYAFTASGSVDRVTVGGSSYNSTGNLVVRAIRVTPIPLVVTSVQIRLDVNIFYVDIHFNEQVDISTILLDPNNPNASSAIYFENPVDPNGAVPNPITDYNISYNEALKIATVQFSQTFTHDHPGVYTLIVDGAAIESDAGIHLDGNGDGATGDNYEQNFQFGDSGDRTTTGTWDPDGDPNTNNTVDFAAPTSLDLIMSDLVGNLGTRNHLVSVVEAVGDHPDTDPFWYPQKMDADIYSITLQAGDVLKISMIQPLPGSSFVGSVSLRDVNGGTLASQATLASGYVVTQSMTAYVAIMGTTLDPNDPRYTGLDSQLDITNATGNFTPPPMVAPIDPNAISNDIGKYQMDVEIYNDGDTGFSLATTLNLVDGQALVTHGYLGNNVNGIPNTPFADADVYDVSHVLLSDNTTTNQLTEGMTITVTLDVESLGGDLGGAGEVGLFDTTGTTGITDALLVGAPGFLDGATHNETFSFKIPRAGTYAIMVQGSTQSDYNLIVTIDTGTAGPRYPQPREQNILLELHGGHVSWFGGRNGEDLNGYSLEDLGFAGYETQVISLVIDQVEQQYADAGVTVHVSSNPADFAGENFTTVFIANNYEPSLYGIAESLDPQNQNENNEAIVFIPTFASLFAPGQYVQLAQAIGNVVSHEAGHTLGLRHDTNPNPFGPLPIMQGGGDPSAPHQFVGDPNDPYGTAMLLTDAWFFGLENEVDLLQEIFDAGA